MQQFDAPCFTCRQELNNVEIDECHFLKIQHDPLCARFYLLGQCLTI